MFRIKRTKHLPPQPMDAITGRPPPAVHYAVRVDPNGCVSLWTTDVDQAADVDEATVARVEAHYAGRSNAGQLSAEPLNPEPAEVPVQQEPPEPMVEDSPQEELPEDMPAEASVQQESPEPAEAQTPQEEHPEQSGRKGRRRRTEE